MSLCEDDGGLLTCSSAMILSPSSSSSCKVEVLTGGGLRGLGLTSGGTRKGLGFGASSSPSYSQNNQPSVTDPHPPLCLSNQQKQLESLPWIPVIIIHKNKDTIWSARHTQAKYNTMTFLHVVGVHCTMCCYQIIIMTIVMLSGNAAQQGLSQMNNGIWS